MSRCLRALFVPVLAVLMLAAVAVEARTQVVLSRKAVIYSGSAARTTAPATIDFKAVRKATPEWKTILAEGVRSGSGRYKLLITQMDKRIRAAVKQVAADKGSDLVVREGDIQDKKGQTVTSLTDAVIEDLEDVDVAVG